MTGGQWEGKMDSLLVGNTDARLGSVVSQQFAPVFVELAQQLSDRKLKLFCCKGVLLRADISRNQRGSILQSLNESCMVDLGHGALLR